MTRARVLSTTQPDLFNDLGGGPCDHARESPAHYLPPSAWQEVPQPVFLSWSDARQLAYCAARDTDAAQYDLPNAEFFRARAQTYKEMINGAK
jgi:hypothetical protein